MPCANCKSLDEELTLLKKQRAQEIAGLKRIIADQDKREKSNRAEIERLKDTVTEMGALIVSLQDTAAGVDRGKLVF